MLSEPFSWTARIENGLLSNFSPISNNLLNKLLHNTIGEKLLENSIFNCAVHKKASKSNFLEQNTFFVNVSRFARNLLSFRTLCLAYFKLVWTPCTYFTIFLREGVSTYVIMVIAQVCLSRQICRTTSVEKHRHEREHHAPLFSLLFVVL